MKKTLALVLAVVLCAACFAFASSAADALSFLPEADSEVAAEGCEYVINDDGSVTITLTAASAKLTVIYKDVVENTIYEEKEVNVTENKYVVYSFDVTGSAQVGDVHVTYNRANKDNADLFKSSMSTVADYAKYKVEEYCGENYNAWAFGTYLSERDDYLPEDGIISFNAVEYPITGAVGDTVTFYNFSVVSTIPENLGSEGDVTDESSEAESSEEPSESVSSEEPTESTEAPAESSEAESSTPSTGDAGIVAVAAVALIAIVGAAVVIRKRA